LGAVAAQPTISNKTRGRTRHECISAP
jgi:hypothetical protein